MPSRRDFLKATLALAAPAVACRRQTAAIGPAPAPRIGYASITWNGRDLEAIDDISALGYRGIQLRSNILSSFGERPQALRQLLGDRRLSFVAFSSGSVSVDPARRSRVIEEHVAHARFLAEAGGLYLQVTDERPAGRAVTPDDCARLGDILTEIGRLCSSLGIPVGYHPHMGTIGERPEDSARVLGASDPRYVRLLLDVAHYQQGGGDPVDAIRRYRERLLLLHVKDLERPVPGDSKIRYRFVEVGRGRVNIKAVFAALREIGFGGWAVVELDDVTEPGRSPRESAEISKRYLEGIGIRVG